MSSIFTRLNTGLFATALFFCLQNLAAQDSTAFLLQPDVIISANKITEPKSDVPNYIRVVQVREIAQQNAPTTADVIQNTGLAFVQKSQQGGGSIVLRGFEANKVLLIVDGVRLNNAIYRAGHLQNIITLDANSLDRIEVLYGAGSTIYGSDAIGGVVNLFTTQPKLQTTAANAFFRYASANQEKTAHVDVNFSTKKWASFTSITASDFSDLRKGAVYNLGYANFQGIDNCLKYVTRLNNQDSLVANDDVNVQRGSAYQQLDIVQKVLFKPTKTTTHLLNLQYSTSSNVPRYDRLQNFTTTPRFSEWYYGPQNRFLASYRFEKNGRYAAADKIVVLPAYQRIDETRFSRRYKSNSLVGTIEKLDIASLTIDAYKTWKETADSQKTAHELMYGAEIAHNKLVSVGQTQNTITQANTSSQSRYPNAQYQTLGIYASHRWEIAENIVVSGGIRYSLTQIAANFDPTYFDAKLTTLNTRNEAFTWNVGATANLKHGFWLSAMLSTAFRAPNIDDLGKTFERNNGTLIIPNPSLRPERIFYKEATLEKRFSARTVLALNLFHGSLTDVIAVRPYAQNGSDSTTYNNFRYQTLANTNIVNAETYGASLTAKHTFASHYTAALTGTYTRGNDLTNGVPLDHIPPIYGNFTISYDQKTWHAAFYSRFNSWKQLADYNPFGEDNQAYATTAGTPAWATFNLRLHKTIHLAPKQDLSLQLAVENLLDSYYRPFSSGIGAAGRNVMATVRYQFQ